MLVSLTVALLLASAPVQNAAPQSDTVEPLIIEGHKKGRPEISDRAIESQLNQLVKDQPNRVVCLRKTTTGTRIARDYCGTLRQWYDFEATRRTQDTIAKLGGPNSGYAPSGGMNGPPPELVSLIRARLQNPKYRAKAEERAKARMEAEAVSKAAPPIGVPTSHP